MPKLILLLCDIYAGTLGSGLNLLTGTLLVVLMIFVFLAGWWMERKGRLVSISAGAGMWILGMFLAYFHDSHIILVTLLEMCAVLFGSVIILGTLIGTLIAYCVKKTKVKKVQE